MIKIKYILLFVLFSLLYTSYLLPSNAYASAEWEVTLRVEAGTGHNQLVIGADGTATDGYDPVWEVYARLGGEIEAYFPHPEWNNVHQVFWRDIRAKSPGETTEWSFVVDSSLNNYDFTIRWDLSRVPENYTIVLIDDTTAHEIDMRSTNFYSFLYTTGVRSFRVAVTAPPDVIPPDPPKGLWATTLGNGRIVTLQWSSNAESDIAGYNVYRSLTSGTGYERLTKSLIKKLYYRDTGLKKGKTYYYVVTAVNTSGMESGYSNEVAVTTFINRVH
ncbi:MAG: fibronectin type III domain-containing protein [Nitrospirota bacterium]